MQSSAEATAGGGERRDDVEDTAFLRRSTIIVIVFDIEPVRTSQSSIKSFLFKFVRCSSIQFSNFHPLIGHALVSPQNYAVFSHFRGSNTSQLT